MVNVSNEVPVIAGCRPDELPLEQLLSGGRPVVLKGLVSRWGLVEAGLRSIDEAMAYLNSFHNGKPLSSSFAPSQPAGRLFYNDDFTRLNFEARRTRLGDVLAEIKAHLDDPQPPTMYIGST